MHCRILHKHVKCQIISLSGGFQVIANLNTYYVFMASFKVRFLLPVSRINWLFLVPLPQVVQLTSEFSHLKMLEHVYVVEDVRDLVQIVRGVTRHGGAYHPEVNFIIICPALFFFRGSSDIPHHQDIYEFIHRRSDWKIEKIVDRSLYNLSFKEDYIVC